MMWTVPPECQGQSVEYSYAQDERWVYRRVTDRSDRSVEYYRASPEDSEAAFEPWNQEPHGYSWDLCNPPQED